MTIKEALNIFSKKYPDKKIVASGNYDNDWFLIEAIDPSGGDDQIDPYYGVSKKDGSVSNYCPDDLEKMIDCLYGSDDTQELGHSAVKRIVGDFDVLCW